MLFSAPPPNHQAARHNTISAQHPRAPFTARLRRRPIPRSPMRVIHSVQLRPRKAMRARLSRGKGFAWRLRCSPPRAPCLGPAWPVCTSRSKAQPQFPHTPRLPHRRHATRRIITSLSTAALPHNLSSYPSPTLHSSIEGERRTCA